MGLVILLWRFPWLPSILSRNITQSGLWLLLSYITLSPPFAFSCTESGRPWVLSRDVKTLKSSVQTASISVAIPTGCFLDKSYRVTVTPPSSDSGPLMKLTFNGRCVDSSSSRSVLFRRKTSLSLQRWKARSMAVALLHVYEVVVFTKVNFSIEKFLRNIALNVKISIKSL